MNKAPSKKELVILFVLWGIALAVSVINPKEYPTWVMETLPVFIVAPILFFSFEKFPMTRLIYFFIFIHGLVLIAGAHYTYAEVPLGFWLQDAFDFARNPYDRIGHFLQGFVPALVAREVLIRQVQIKSRFWVFILSVCICMAFSAFYELLEWSAALIMGEGADSFLGLQGDEWDTQWDMFLATVGAITAMLMVPFRPNK